MSAKNTGDAPTQKPSSRQWFGAVVVYLLIPLSLFLCSGDLYWWQAWLYTLFICVAGIGGRIWAEWRHPGLMASRQNRQIIQQAKNWDKVLAPLMAVSVSYPMVIVAGLDHRFNWSSDFPPWLIATGMMLILLGYAFASWALAENRYFFSVVSIQTERGHVVCDSGPYRLVRHPGYAGNAVALFGIVLALTSIWALIPAMLAIIITVIRTVLEDQTLQNELPGYQDYARRVRYRLLPWIF